MDKPLRSEVLVGDLDFIGLPLSWQIARAVGAPAGVNCQELAERAGCVINTRNPVALVPVPSDKLWQASSGR